MNYEVQSDLRDLRMGLLKQQQERIETAKYLNDRLDCLAELLNEAFTRIKNLEAALAEKETIPA